MTSEELRTLPEGAKLTYVVGEGENERRYPAERRHAGAGWVMLKVWYAPDDGRAFRWSTDTGKPRHESRGYVGKVRLEHAP